MNVHSVAMQQALEQIKAMREEISAASAHKPRVDAGSSAISQPVEGEKSFGELVRSAVDSVSQQQQMSRDLQVAYARGDDVSLTDVAIAMQKSSVAFEATVQVRNKILESYKEIMNMAV